MKKWIVLGLLLFCCSTAHAVELKIITTNGFVAFTVPDHWLVISMQSKPPISVAGFQIPNPADEGTPDSTNLAISLYHPGSEKAQAALAKVGQPYGDAVVKTSAFKDWTIYTQEPKQGETVYTLMDAKRNVADVAVTVRLAWPHLPNNPPDYGKQMSSVFEAVLESIYGEIGAYKPREGEIVRRPVK